WLRKVKQPVDTNPAFLSLAASDTHDYPERALAVGPNGAFQKAARLYDTANAVITIGNERGERTLRPERRLVVMQQYKNQALAYCPAGPLTREEVELTNGHFDTLSLPGLLPGRAVAQGATWKVANEVAQGLCNFEGLTGQDLTCKLEEVAGKVARVSVTGSATGIDLGAMVKLTIQATYRFDLTAGRLVWLEWKQKDERSQGPVSP